LSVKSAGNFSDAQIPLNGKLNFKTHIHIPTRKNNDYINSNN